MKISKFLSALGACLLAAAGAGRAEMVAMVNYDSKAGITPRREGVAFVDVDLKSPRFGQILEELPLPADARSHHFFYNRDLSKAYITSLGNGPLRVMNMNRKPYRIKLLDVPQCRVAEDLAFAADNKT